MAINNKPLLLRLAILLEVPQLQDDQREYNTLQQAYTDLMYSVDLEHDTTILLQDKLKEFSV